MCQCRFLHRTRIRTHTHAYAHIGTHTHTAFTWNPFTCRPAIGPDGAINMRWSIDELANLMPVEFTPGAFERQEGFTPRSVQRARARAAAARSPSHSRAAQALESDNVVVSVVVTDTTRKTIGTQSEISFHPDDVIVFHKGKLLNPAALPFLGFCRRSNNILTFQVRSG